MLVTTNDFYNLAEQNHIPVLRCPLPVTGSLSLHTPTGDIIGIDDSQKMTSGEEQAHIGHEVAHCLYGGFYNRASSFDTVERHEVRADHWYIKRAIPRKTLFQLLRHGYDADEIAEQLNTTEEYVRRAYYYYKDNP